MILRTYKLDKIAPIYFLDSAALVLGVHIDSVVEVVFPFKVEPKAGRKAQESVHNAQQNVQSAALIIDNLLNLIPCSQWHAFCSLKVRGEY